MDACLRSAERPFQDLAPLKEKHFCPFVEFFFGILRSVSEFLRLCEVNWDVFVNRLRMYGGARPCMRNLFTKTKRQIAELSRHSMIPCLKLTEVLKMENSHVNQGFHNF